MTRDQSRRIRANIASAQSFIATARRVAEESGALVTVDECDCADEHLVDAIEGVERLERDQILNQAETRERS